MRRDPNQCRAMARAQAIWEEGNGTRSEPAEIYRSKGDLQNPVENGIETNFKEPVRAESCSPPTRG